MNRQYRQSVLYLAILFGRFVPIAVLLWYGYPMVVFGIMLFTDFAMVAGAIRSGARNVTPA